MLYVICGKKRSGKSEAARLLKDIGTFEEFALGDHVKEMLDDVGRNYNHKFKEKRVFWEGDRDKTLLLLNNIDVSEIIDCVVRKVETLGYTSINKEQLCRVKANVRGNEELWTPRRLMQLIGTDLVCDCVSPEVWTMLALKRIITTATKEHVVIPDCRQEHEYKYLRNLGAKFIFIERDTGMVDNHSTEKGLQPKEGDVTILNNGTLEDLETQLLDIINE